jgi:DNA-binding NarL/FixJ family response regulator
MNSDISAARKNAGCIRVLITDDQPRARRSLEALLTAMRWSALSHTEHPAHDSANRVPFPVEIVGEAGDGQQAIDQIQALRPDVVVMELHMPRLDGLTAISIIKSRWPDVRIVVLTMYATDRAAALDSGADAFLLKGCPTDELLEAVMPNLREL